MTVELLAPEETENILRKLRHEESNGFGFDLKGHITAVCREEKTGEEVWTVDQDNLITNWAKRLYFAAGEGLRSNVYIILLNSTETPDPRRCTMPIYTGLEASYASYGPFQLTSNNVTEHSRTWSCVFGAPSVSRTIAMVGINHDNQVWNWWSSPAMCAYSRISPSKVQSTSQTVEISYKLFLLPLG